MNPAPGLPAGLLAGKRIGLLSARASRANGGVFEAVVLQAEMLRASGAVPVVVAVEDAAHSEDRWRLDGAEVHLAPLVGPPAIAFAPRLGDVLDAARLDCLHLHGIWQYPTHAAGRWARRSGGPLVVSPHGMFDPWIIGRNRWKKVLAGLVWERRGWRAAAAMHALTIDEARDIRRGVPQIPDLRVIPNAAPAAVAHPTRGRPPMALYIGRIHEKKNLAALIEGWHLALPGLPAGALLTIAGWGDDAGVAALEASISREQALADSVEFVGTAFGSQKAALFDVARFFVLPSLSEGLPMAILEAWAAGTPVIMSEACHLPEGFAAGAALRCGTTPDAIAAALLAGFALEDAPWNDMADAAYALAAGPFSAATVGSAWNDFYASLLAPRRG